MAVTKFCYIHCRILLRPARNFATIGICGWRRPQPRIREDATTTASHFCYHHVSFCYNQNRFLLHPAVSDAEPAVRGAAKSGRGCYNRLPVMLESAMRRVASRRHGCYNRLGVKLQPLAFFCWKRPPAMLQPSSTDAKTVNGGSYMQRW